MSARRAGYPASMLLPPGAAIYGWDATGCPLRWGGLGAALIVSAVISMMMPAILVSLPSMPMLLVPPDWRKKYRRRRKWSWRTWSRQRVPRKKQQSAYIPAWLERVVFAADRYQCCFCGETGDLAVDHIFPWSLGGLTALWNLALLCRYHNTVKSNYWKFKSGRSVYVPVEEESASRELAAEVLEYELRHRWWPGRWIRAGLELAA